MADTTITIRLVGPDEDGGSVQFGDFRAFWDVLSHCLRRSEAVVTHEAGRVHYRVIEITSGSPVQAVLEAAPPKKGLDRRPEILGLFKGTVLSLQVGTPVDQRLTTDDLNEFRKLAGLKRTKEVWIEGRQITTQFLANIEKILGAAVRAKGSVSGLLEALNVHDKNEFILYPPILNARVVCTFPGELFEKVRGAVKRNVTVSGILFYQPDRPFPERVQVEGMEVHPPHDQLPTLKELRGLFKGATGDKTAAEFIRAIRDEQEG